mmetsp:Transcript_21047/g.34365  ORF Transcript_21047/g.34365 Transcript_21047/m.34365 type:complete len:580 (+) Transcript_21047:121-1860(+)|eukprot:CAMPEP_0203758734 /NCGR_PEP_ID=MMETSP0098-20131031/11556_1 /ASSEMBLY_ACC=CAM_ASM_000208 /TAXON_ID=96639 /ORGANISM=" , Strain NY0313808BC1" /LENGTH=579 /DNA_ID=CAMNT_0050651299 /DNA_START=108 /DNA_END=1847 /DNA_ORIENTATION=-
MQKSGGAPARAGGKNKKKKGPGKKPVPVPVKKVESESESESSSDDDELVAMMQFIGDKQGLKEKKSRTKRVTENETARRTREITEEHRKKEKAEKMSKERQALHDLTIKNMSAASSKGWADMVDEEESEDDALAGVLTEAQAQEKFKEFVSNGQKLLGQGNVQGAVDLFRDGLLLCERYPNKPKWSATMQLSLGTSLFRLGDVRESIADLLKCLRTVRSVKPVDQTIEKQALRKLIEAYVDIGKMEEADRCRVELDRLAGKSPAGPEAPASQLSGNEFHPALAESLDQAIEAGMKGQFALLKALLFAFRDGRLDITRADIVNYQHSETLASCLMVAAGRGQTRLIHGLLYAGADLNAAAADGSTALIWACRFNQPNSALLLLESGAQFDANLDAKVMEGWSPQVQQTIGNFINSKKAQLAQAAKPAPPKKEKDTKKGQGGKKAKGEKTLEKWADEPDSSENQNQTLEEQVTSTKAWDQFETNRNLGVKTQEFNESLYTTKLDVDSISAEAKKKAEELVQLINSEKKQRGRPSDDYDEEAAHSAVVRGDSALVDDDGFTDVSVLRKKNKKKNKPRQKKKT